MSILAIDYGSRKIGLAKSNEEKTIALPLKVLANHGRKKILAELDEVFEQNNIDQIVVGVPVSLKPDKRKTFWRQKDLQNKQMKEVLEFVHWLTKNTKISVEVEDERLSTKLANGLRKDLVKKGPDDAVAAMLILQTYLDKK